MRRKVFATVAVLTTVALLGVVGTFAAFTATTTNSSNSVSSGTVKIDQHPGSTSLYAASGKKPGEDTTGCVRVSYGGSLPAMVRLYASAGITNGSAFNLKVERGAGLSSPGASMSCAGFSASSSVYNGPLSGFASSWSGGGQGKAGGVAWATNNQVDYRFTVTPNDDTAANGHTTAQSTSAHDFTWEARNYGGYPGDVLGTTGLQSYWRLGEASGTTAFDTAPGGNADGTYGGGPNLGRPSLTSDSMDNAAGLDGTDDKVDFGDKYDFAGTTSFSAELWVNPTSANDSGFRGLIEKRLTDGAGQQGWVVYISPTSGGVPGTFRFERWRDGAPSGSSTGSVTRATPGQLAHIVTTYDGSRTRMYVNGALEGTSNVAATSLLDTTATLKLGGFTTGSRLAGDLDDVSIYGGALSASEVKAHYDAGK